MERVLLKTREPARKAGMSDTVPWNLQSICLRHQSILLFKDKKLPGLHLQGLDGAGARGRGILLRTARRALLHQGALQRRELPAQRLRPSAGQALKCTSRACMLRGQTSCAKQQEPERALLHGALCPYAPSGSRSKSRGLTF